MFGKKKFTGIARDVQIRVEETIAIRYILSFKLESAGSLIPVEMRGRWNKSLRGSIAEGDPVEIKGTLKDWGIEAMKISNLKTGFEVKFD